MSGAGRLTHAVAGVTVLQYDLRRLAGRGAVLEIATYAKSAAAR